MSKSEQQLRMRRLHALDAAYTAACGARPGDDANLCYYLGDDPSYCKTWSMHSGKVPTYRLGFFNISDVRWKNDR